MERSNDERKTSKGVWALFGAAIGAILGIIAYNNHWLG